MTGMNSKAASKLWKSPFFLRSERRAAHNLYTKLCNLILVLSYTAIRAELTYAVSGLRVLAVLRAVIDTTCRALCKMG